MARPKRNKPKSPEQIAAEKLAARQRLFEVVGLQPEAANLPSSDDIHLTRAGDKREGDGKKVNDNSASRADAFTALRDGMAVGAYDAARKLEADIRIRRGENDRGRPLQRVDGEGEGGDYTAAIIDAGLRVDAVLKRIGERDAWLLSELIAPRAETAIMYPTWRGVVGYITGEENAHAQAAAVRSACANLAMAYESLPSNQPLSTARAAHLAAA